MAAASSDVVVPTVTALYRAEDALRRLLDGRPAVNRLLTPAQERAADRLVMCLHAAAFRLGTETRPDFRPGQRVRTVRTFEAVRSPCPAVGSSGAVSRVEQDHAGWWVCVAMTRPFLDADGRTEWSADPDDEDLVVRFKADELVKTGGRPSRRHAAKGG